MQFAGASLKMSLVLIVIGMVGYMIGVAAIGRATIRPAMSKPPFIGFGGVLSAPRSVTSKRRFASFGGY